MNGWLKIRDTGVSVLEVLDLLSRGYTRRDVRRRLPPLTDKDISLALSVAHDFILQTLVMSLFGHCPPVYRQPETLDGKSEHDLPDSLRDEVKRLCRYGATKAAIARLLQITPEQIAAALNDAARNG